MSKKIKFIVSACLAGEKCRYDCQSKPNQKIMDLVTSGEAISLCPEQLGGLSTPRPAAEVQKDGKVLTIDGVDLSLPYQQGAKEAWKMAQSHPIRRAYLKSKSPMCGSSKIYDGSFSGKLTNGKGAFATLLAKHGITIKSIE
jgi:uncharacterized protein YbbK (DUF523 family)